VPTANVECNFVDQYVLDQSETIQVEPHIIKKTVMMMILFGHHVVTALNVPVENGNQL
jgi:hypothetical protein